MELLGLIVVLGGVDDGDEWHRRRSARRGGCGRAVGRTVGETPVAVDGGSGPQAVPKQIGVASTGAPRLSTAVHRVCGQPSVAVRRTGGRLHISSPTWGKPG